MDREPSTPISKPRILRRSYLKLLGVSAVPVVTRRTQAAEGRGYGEGGYGEGGYGGIEDGNGDEDSDDDGNGTGDDDNPIEPSVVTDPVTGVTDSSATLNGRVTDLGDAEAVDLRFEYRETGSSTWSTTEARRLTAEASWSETVEDLGSETEYEYRLLASSDDATVTSETQSFVTSTVEIGEPTIESLRVEDTSGPNPHVDLEVEWSVSHDDDALEEGRVTIRDSNDEPVDDATIDVTGSRDSGSETFRIKHGSGEASVVTLTVGDRAGNTTSEDATIRT